MESDSAAAQGGSAGESTANVPCRTVQSPEIIPNRLQSFEFEGGSSERAIFTRDLYSIFKTHCGACHVDTNLGNFRVKEQGLFANDTNDQQDVILSTMTSDDPEVFMPPPEAGGMPHAMRTEGDPILELEGLLRTWFENGSPQDLFYVPTAEVSDPGYRLTEDVAMGMTNLGNCVPNKQIVGEDKAMMNDRDTFFAEMKTLPPLLSQTDLVTFDAEALARRRILSFAPVYPLFSDQAKKMRHVRVPRGQTLAFDRNSQEFSVPPNTRLYKTFFKEVTDINGDQRYKKIETRIIVSRPDGPDGPNGEHETHSLFGTYQWNESETEAFLITDPLRNGKPFRDRLITYVTNEQRAEEILAQDPLDKVVALQEGGAVRSYAIPGADRCVQCHMGAINGSFVIGLSPMQLRARPKGQGGVIEEVGADEMNQLQRFIDYGLISGMKSVDEVLPLEDSQDTRKARNKYELAAQGYMLGNCAYCHNPRGFPTTQNPELKNLLNFAPSKMGGIFQFPLDRTSPRIRRGLAQDINIPYISPSLIDYAPSEQYTDKWMASGKDGKSAVYLAAPWRSLIYRNIDSPFPYSEDFALYPHMPMNSPGFDCRAPRIMGDWMVSIPSKRIIAADAEKDKDGKPIPPAEWTVPSQSYEEVKPDATDYNKALEEADKRMKAYHGNFTQIDRDEFTKSEPDAKGKWPYTPYLAGYRSTMYCPDTSDIIDPSVTGSQLVPQDKGSSLPSMYHDFVTKEKDPAEYIESVVKFAQGTADGVPDMTHWVVTDITDTPGDWYPRRTDWDKVLVTQDPASAPADLAQQRAVKELQTRRLSDDFRKLVLTPHPFTIWKDKPECDLSKQRTVDSYTGAERLRWMDRAYEDRPAPKGSDHVYTQSWGEAVYNEICVNCHGPNYDSRGRQADTLMTMTGGDTRVANFRAGLFGPESDPHANVERIFQPFAKADATADDLAARYVSWMGLGGTQRTIPPVIMNVVATLAVFGEKRPVGLDLTQSGANMLAIASILCEHALGFRRTQVASFDESKGLLMTLEPTNVGDKTVGLLDISGDYEMWMEICSYNNPPPVRVVQPRGGAWTEWKDLGKRVTFSIYGNTDPAPFSWYKPETYPPDSLIGDERGRVAPGLTPSNQFPWCVMKPTATEDQLIAGDWVGKVRNNKPLPYCPQAWIFNDSNKLTLEDIDTWTTRGAINAGFAVYAYLDELAQKVKAGGTAQPAFDRCEQLPK